MSNEPLPCVWAAFVRPPDFPDKVVVCRQYVVERHKTERSRLLEVVVDPFACICNTITEAWQDRPAYTAILERQIGDPPFLFEVWI